MMQSKNSVDKDVNKTSTLLLFLKPRFEKDALNKSSMNRILYITVTIQPTMNIISVINPDAETLFDKIKSFE